jgi:hypothetical protein
VLQQAGKVLCDDRYFFSPYISSHNPRIHIIARKGKNWWFIAPNVDHQSASERSIHTASSIVRNARHHCGLMFIRRFTGRCLAANSVRPYTWTRNPVAFIIREKRPLFHAQPVADFYAGCVTFL